MKFLATIKWMIILCCLVGSQSLAASGGTAAYKDRSNLPINIKSNEMSADNKGKTAIFTGKVVAKQGDITIYADKLTINYSDVKGDVQKIEADGNVRIVHESSIGVASHAVYDSKLGRIILTGKPQVMHGKSNISGTTITYNIDEDKSIVSGDGNTRVEATIEPPPKKSNVGPR